MTGYCKGKGRSMDVGTTDGNMACDDIVDGYSRSDGTVNSTNQGCHWYRGG